MATPNGLARIDTTHAEKKAAAKHENGICHDDSSAPVRAQNIDELHSMQRKRSAPTTPIKDTSASPFAVAVSDEDRRKQQLQSIRSINISILSSLLLSHPVPFCLCFYPDM
uniref:Uncharacterized protein n=1 Tax=Aegilops tauschii subsp. strangulata TaxID=200361 RepID=A0A453IH41_AEGTS